MATKQLETDALGTEVGLRFDGPWTGYWLAFLRVVAGWYLLHSGLTKLLENGLMMPASGLTWFLNDQTAITYPIMHAFTGGLLPVVQFMIPVGEFLVGLGLVLGCLTRLAAYNGAILLSFFYFGNHSWTHGMVTAELLGVLVFVTIALFGAGRVWGVDQYLERTDWVRNNRWMRYLLG